MSLGLRLEVRQSQGLVLTPQLQQAIKLLQLSNLELSGVVDRECAENPFLQRTETAATLPAAPAARDAPPLDGRPELRPEGRPATDEGWAPPAAGPAADQRLGLKRSATGPSAHDDPPLEGRLARPRGLRDLLREQVAARLRDERLRALAFVLVDEVEDDGYLRDDDVLLADRYRVPEALVGAARAALQRCEPTGVGARDLAECLALQLAERDRLDPAMRRLLDHLPLLARADFAALMRLCAVDAEDLQGMIAELKTLDPKPGLAFGVEPSAAAIPDLFVFRVVSGAWRIELNNATLPRVLVDTAYYAELCSRKLERRDREYVNERMQSAGWLARALDQRARTVLKVAKAIFARQRRFLSGGVQQLRPLVLREVAVATGLHESTISRATADKYVMTPWGTLPLKYFFTTAIAATSGEESHSAEAIRQQLKRMIEREDPESILSDDQIVAALGRSGVAIARRTVAKYREALGIPSSVQRRRLKALGR
ncbi:MAG TPA: RNA polymerase factor sigma-54 [Geminicoccaceae bacterium]|nr:RNA polymerase factor sigma-54 [Geminicoccaceae bacterium]